MKNMLQEWESRHRKTIIQEIKEAGIELKAENIPRIIKETSFRTRKQKHQRKCPYYKNEESCHPEIKELNCFLCACPEYISEKEEGGCKINSEYGKFTHHENLPAGKVWDCSGCNLYHKKDSVRTFLEKNLEELTKLL